MRTWIHRTLVTTMLLLGAASASADEFPARPITIVVPFGAGSGSDIAARFYARALKEKLNATVVVDLKPGAAGMIAEIGRAHV